MSSGADLLATFFDTFFAGDCELDLADSKLDFSQFIVKNHINESNYKCHDICLEGIIYRVCHGVYPEDQCRWLCVKVNGDSSIVSRCKIYMSWRQNGCLKHTSLHIDGEAYGEGKTWNSEGKVKWQSIYTQWDGSEDCHLRYSKGRFSRYIITDQDQDQDETVIELEKDRVHISTDNLKRELFKMRKKCKKALNRCGTLRSLKN